MENIIPKAMELLTLYGLKIIAAIVVFIVGRWVAKILRNITKKVMTKKRSTPRLFPLLQAWPTLH